jgi:hypothetical protein
LALAFFLVSGGTMEVQDKIDKIILRFLPADIVMMDAPFQGQHIDPA